MQTHGIHINGPVKDEQTRCIHYNSPIDIIAIKFKCCGEYYPCYKCHQEDADHEAEVWDREEFDQEAILCGVCGKELTVIEYLQSDSTCPDCSSSFNPGCQLHAHLYFDAGR